MKATGDRRLKFFMQKHIPFQALKKAGFFAGVRFNDYEEQARRICNRFGLKNIYDYTLALPNEKYQGFACSFTNRFGDTITTIIEKELNQKP